MQNVVWDNLSYEEVAPCLHFFLNTVYYIYKRTYKPIIFLFKEIFFNIIPFTPNYWLGTLMWV